MKGDVKKAIIIVPSNLISVWEEHLNLWAPEIQFVTIRDSKEGRKVLWNIDSHVYLISYDSLKTITNIIKIILESSESLWIL